LPQREPEEVATPESKDPVPPTTEEVATARAQLIEADEEGHPVIVRHVNSETGVGRTVVMNEDGTMRMFGADTVSSMTARDEGDIAEWIASMTERHLRGLVNEVRERVVESSQALHSRRTELERLSRQVNFEYFGLSEGACAKELDNVYRRLARGLHPDKNGGTEEAKRRFQVMKSRYEELREQLAEAAQGLRKEEQSGNTESGSEGTCLAENTGSQQEEAAKKAQPEAAQEEQDGKQGKAPREEGEQEAAKKDASESQAELPALQSGQACENLYCPQVNSRDESVEHVWKMLRQLKMINQNLKIVECELQRVQADREQR